MIFKLDNKSANLAGAYSGACFLVCGGPSLTSMDLSLLHRPGIMSMAINNAWDHCRPNFWTAVDPPYRFSYHGWMDPAICKLIPSGRRYTWLQKENAKGQIIPADVRADRAPNVYTFKAGTQFEPSTFLTDEIAHYGRKDKEPDSLGIAGRRNTMLSAFRLIYELGFRRVYLIGADFKMDEQNHYASNQRVSEASVIYHNKLYADTQRRFEAIDWKDMQVMNCTPGSGLTCFPYVQFRAAIEQEQLQRPRARNWYSEGKPEARRAREQERYKRLFEQSKQYGTATFGAGTEAFVAKLAGDGLVVDLGCGANLYVEKLRELGVNALGVDFAHSAADITAYMHNVKEVEKGKAKVLTYWDSIEHVLPEDVRLVLREADRMLSDDGYIIARIATWKAPSNPDGYNLHLVVKRLEWWMRQLQQRVNGWVGLLPFDPESNRLNKLVVLARPNADRSLLEKKGIEWRLKPKRIRPRRRRKQKSTN